METQAGYEPYKPLLTLKEWGPSIWTVDGPEVRYGFGPLQVPCPTRMTIVQTGDGSVLVHSPVELTDALAAEIADIGDVKALIAPNQNHFLFLAPWAKTYPQAQVFAAPGLAGKTGVPPHTALTHDLETPWSDDLYHIRLDLGDFTESVFYHRASRTVIVTDLMMNYEAERVRGFLMRLFLSLGGASGPRGNPSVDMRMALRPHREALKAGLAKMIEWEPERIILAHGKCYETGAVGELQRAFPGLTYVSGGAPT